MREKTSKAQQSIDSREIFAAIFWEKSNKELWITSLVRKKYMLINTQRVQGFIDIVCSLPKSKTYQTSSSIHYFFLFKETTPKS